jgi:hypothetical protein
MHLGTLVLIVWLGMGALAAGQRHEFTHITRDCNMAATIGVTILAGPLNYVGLNPKISCRDLPEPSN